MSAHIPSQDTPPEAPEDLPNSHSLCLSVSLDHLSLSEDSQASSIPSSEGMDTDMDAELVWRQQVRETAIEMGPASPASSHLSAPTQDARATPEDLKFESDEDGDYTWSPTRRVSTSARRKSKRGRADRGPLMLQNKKASCPTQPKKKCVNGFIMFCRMNRKQYIRWVGSSWAASLPEHVAPSSAMCFPQRLTWPHCIGQGLSIVSRETHLRLKKNRTLVADVT